MAPLPKLALARQIVRDYMRDDFHPIIVYGDLRIGKSAYSIKALTQVLDYLWGYDKMTPKLCKEFMGWDPEENVENWMSHDERRPCFIWDDAGYWLHSLNWHDPVLVAIQKYMNVVGTDFNTFILTTPDPGWILSKMANMPGMIRVRIVKRDGGHLTDAPSKLFSRLGIGYKPWKSPDLKKGGVNKVLRDTFSCKLPDEFYNWYKPYREEYATKAKKQILKSLHTAKRETSIRELSAMRRLRKLEKDLFKKVKSDKVKVGSNIEFEEVEQVA